MNTELIFEPPRYDTRELFHVYNTNNTLVKLLEQKVRLSENQLLDLRRLPDTYLICFLNGFEEAKEQLENARGLIKVIDQEAYDSLKEALRVIRKVRYN
jgi:hypothetical protein